MICGSLKGLGSGEDREMDRLKVSIAASPNRQKEPIRKPVRGIALMSNGTARRPFRGEAAILDGILGKIPAFARAAARG
jgi:hypothetical protein